MPVLLDGDPISTEVRHTHTHTHTHIESLQHHRCVFTEVNHHFLCQVHRQTRTEDLPRRLQELPPGVSEGNISGPSHFEFIKYLFHVHALMRLCLHVNPGNVGHRQQQGSGVYVCLPERPPERSGAAVFPPRRGTHTSPTLFCPTFSQLSSHCFFGFFAH